MKTEGVQKIYENQKIYEKGVQGLLRELCSKLVSSTL